MKKYKVIYERKDYGDGGYISAFETLAENEKQAVELCEKNRVGVEGILEIISL